MYSDTVYLQFGYPFYIVSPFTVSRGNLLILDQTLGGLVELKSSQFRSDYLIKGNKLIKLNSNENIKISVKVHSYMKMYETFYSLHHKYSFSDWYNLTVSISNTTLAKKIFISDFKNLFSSCYLSSFDSAKCSCLIYSQTVNDVLNANNERIALQDKKVNYIGYAFMDIKQDLNTTENKFYLLSIKIPSELFLKGFEIFANQYGQIKIDLLTCVLNEPCFSKEKILKNSLNVTNTWVLNLNKGLNKIELPENALVTENSVFVLNQNNSIVSIDYGKKFLVDYKVNKYLELIPMNSRFCLNILIGQYFYQNLRHFEYKFPTYGKHVIRFGLEKSKLMSKHEILIEKCKLIFLIAY